MQVAFLQETHLTKNMELHVGSRWAGVRVASSFSSYSRCVMLLVKKGTPYTFISSKRDEQGRILLVLGKLGDTMILFVNTYVPNIDDSTFFNDVWRCISSYQSLYGAVT